MVLTGGSGRRPRVLLLLWSIPHYRAPVYRQLCQNPNLDFVVCSGEEGTTFGGAKVASAHEAGHAAGIRWRRLESRRVRGPLLRGFEWQPEAVRIAWRERFDAVIMGGHMSPSNWLVRLICRFRKIPVLDWYIGVKRPEAGLKWTLRRLYYKWSAAQLLYGEHARNFYVRHGFRPDEIFVVRNSLDHDRQVVIRAQITPEDVRQTRAQFGAAGADDRLAFCSGRLEARKRLDVLIQALGLLRTRGRRVLLVLIGDGPETENLRRQAAALGVADQVVFYGPCYDEPTLGRIMSASDLCVSPGATGLTVMHSLVYGTPILTQENTPWLRRSVRGHAGVGSLVALDFGGNDWLHGPEVEAVIEGQTGGFVRGDNAEDWAGKMEHLLYPVSAKVHMADACMKEIDEHWTPRYQERVVIQALNRVLPRHRRIPQGP